MRGSARRAAAIITSCFLAGCILRSLSVDTDILFREVTSIAEDKAERLYLQWWNAPLGVKALLHAVIIVQGLSIASKLASYSESALYFDGTSLVIYIFGLAIYFGSTLPNIFSLTPVDTPQPAIFNLNELLNLNRKDGHPKIRTALEPDERTQALAIVCASSVLLLAGIAGILLMQVGDWFVEKKAEQALRADELQKIEAIRGRLKAD